MTSDLAQQLDSLTTWIARLEDEAANGSPVDLDGLDREVAKACDAVAARPEDEVAALRPNLDALLTAIDRLQKLMRDQYDGIRAELQAHGRRSQANRAYGQWGTPKPPKSP
jgi:hypothetical protein